MWNFTRMESGLHFVLLGKISNVAPSFLILAIMVALLQQPDYLEAFTLIYHQNICREIGYPSVQYVKCNRPSHIKILTVQLTRDTGTQNDWGSS